MRVAASLTTYFESVVQDAFGNRNEFCRKIMICANHFLDPPGHQRKKFTQDNKTTAP
jgi:hypothetical protein